MKVYIPGIMKQRSTSDMDISNGSGGEGRFAARPSRVQIEELGEDSHASAGSGEGSKASNVNPFTTISGAVDGPRPMFRPLTSMLNAPTTPSVEAAEAFRSRPSVAGTPKAAEALAMMMQSEYPEGLPEDIHGVSHFGASQDDYNEPSLVDFVGEADMDVGYDDDDVGDGLDLPAAPRKRTVSGQPHKRLRAEMDRRKSLALAGLQASEDGVRRSTRQRSKPLEYWRGETKVYQRVHNSLPTVVQLEKRTANPIWPRKTPGGPSQLFRISRLRPAEVLRDIGVQLPEPSPMDRRGVRYGLMPPPPPASWAEKYGINPLSSRPSMTPGKAPRARDADDDDNEGIALKPAKKKRGRPAGSKNKQQSSIADEEIDEVEPESIVADMVAKIFANVVAANRSPVEVEAAGRAETAMEATTAEVDVVDEVEETNEEEATTGALESISEEGEDEEAMDEDEDEEERQLQLELDAAVADAERELAEEIAADEAEKAALANALNEGVVVEDVEEASEEENEIEDAVELNVNFSRADTEVTTSRDGDDIVVEQPRIALEILREIDANENVDETDVEHQPSARKLAKDGVTDDENKNTPRRRARDRGVSLTTAAEA